MDLKRIKLIIEDSRITDTVKQSLIIAEISKNENVLPALLGLLNSERERRKELVSTMNLLLSKADVGLKEPKLNEDGFMQKEIAEFYDTAEVSHFFKNKN